jgi:hypothetical protein
VNHEPVLDLITTPETSVTARAEHLRQRISTLTEQLAGIETELADLAASRTALLRLSGADGPTPADATLPSTGYQQISPCSPPPAAGYAPRTSAARSASAPPRTTPKACAPHSDASSPAAC